MSEAALQLDDFNTADLRALADRLLETTKVEYVDAGALLIINPPGIDHRRIVRSIVQSVIVASHTGQAALNWAVDQNFQWDFADDSRRFFIPDIVLIHRRGDR